MDSALGVLGQALECSICLEQLDVTSRVLPCQHTFCKSCLMDIINSRQELRCPECRVLVTVPLDSLKPNILLMRILEGIKSFPQTVSEDAEINCLKPQIETKAVTEASATLNISKSNHYLTKPLDQLSISDYPSLAESLASQLSNSSFSGPSFMNCIQSSLESLNLPSSTDEVTQNNNAISTPTSITVPTTTAGANVGTKNDISDSFTHSLLTEQIANITNVSIDPSLDTSSSLTLSSEVLPNYVQANLSGVNICEANEDQEQIDDSNTLNSSLLSSASLELESTPSFQSLIAPLNIQAKALYSYKGRTERDLNFNKGDIIRICKKIDENWFYGELHGHLGFIPATYVKALEPLPVCVPQCRALFDFKISSEEEKNCLTFVKNDTITVLRRIDDNWAEGKLAARIGIFPLSFVRLNNAAKILLNLPSSEFPAPACMSSLPSETQLLLNSPSSFAIAENFPDLPIKALHPLDSVLNSSASSLPRAFLHHSSEILQPTRVGPSSLKNLSSHSLSKRHSLAEFRCCISSTNTVSVPVRRRTTSSEARIDEENKNVNNSVRNEEHLNVALANKCDSVDVQHQSSDVSLQLYVAMYTYGPRKADEVELKRGYLYYVTDMCQDGWFKGCCLATNKCGVFPGNYVQLAKPQAIQTFLSHCSVDSNPSCGSVNALIPILSNMYSTRITTLPTEDFGLFTNFPTNLPELPPRNETISSNVMGTQIVDGEKGLSRCARSTIRSLSVCSSPEKKQYRESEECISLIKKLNIVTTRNYSNKQTKSEKYSVREAAIEGTKEGTSKLAKQPVPLMKERYRCIEAYPATGNHELELKVGDVIYVHKKREDGWYKGTLLRTGKTGLFPANFVESC